MSTTKAERLAALVKEAGSTRAATRLIMDSVGCAPTHSAIHKATHGAKTTEYTLECYIRDLESALKRQKGNDNA